MFNPTELVINKFVENLRGNYLRTYGILEPEYPNIRGLYTVLPQPVNLTGRTLSDNPNHQDRAAAHSPALA